jgi:hypothetical protein
LNLYSYVHNNPYKYTDPTGHLPDGPGGGAMEEGYIHFAQQSNAACAAGGSCIVQKVAGAVAGVLAAASAVAVLGVAAAVLAPAEPAVEEAVEEAGPAVEGEASAAEPQLSAQAQKGIRSLQDRIAEHEQKLADFKANPTVRPGMENQPAEVIGKQQQARIEHLEREIQTFKSNIEKLKKGE